MGVAVVGVAVGRADISTPAASKKKFWLETICLSLCQKHDRLVHLVVKNKILGKNLLFSIESAPSARVKYLFALGGTS